MIILSPEEWVEYALANLSQEVMETVDDIEEGIAKNLELVSPPLQHIFTPGLYTRTILMQAGLIVVSKIHRFQHPFVISQGKVSIWNALDQQCITVTAPHVGITEPGTRRVLYTHEDTIWSTFHVTDETDVDKIIDRITVPYTNPRLEKALHERGEKPPRLR